jgi:hypothetical protein
MLGVIAPDTEHATNRETFLVAGDGEAGNGGGIDDVSHAARVTARRIGWLRKVP